MHLSCRHFFSLNFITFCIRNRKQVRAKGKWHGSEHLQRQSGNSLGKDALLRIWIVGTARAFTMTYILLLHFGFSLAGTSEAYRNVISCSQTHSLFLMFGNWQGHWRTVLACEAWDSYHLLGWWPYLTWSASWHLLDVVGNTVAYAAWDSEFEDSFCLS